MLKLTEHVGIAIFLLYKQKPREILIFRTFTAKFWIFAYFTQNIIIFGSGMFLWHLLWHHNYVTPWPIVLILVCMRREGPNLPFDTKINFIGVRFGKSTEGVVTTLLVRRVTKNSLVRRRLNRAVLNFICLNLAVVLFTIDYGFW